MTQERRWWEEPHDPCADLAAAGIDDDECGDTAYIMPLEDECPECGVKREGGVCDICGKRL